MNTLCRNSIVRDVVQIDSNVRITVHLIDRLANPSVEEAVLEILVSNARELDSLDSIRGALLGAWVQELFLDRDDDSERLEFWNDVHQLANLSGDQVSQHFRTFEDADWIFLVGSLRESLDERGGEVQRLKASIREVESLVERRSQSAARILDAADEHPDRALVAKGRVQTLNAIRDVLSRLKKKDA